MRLNCKTTVCLTKELGLYSMSNGEVSIQSMELKFKARFTKNTLVALKDKNWKWKKVEAVHHDFQSPVIPLSFAKDSIYLSIYLQGRTHLDPSSAPHKNRIQILLERMWLQAHYGWLVKVFGLLWAKVGSTFDGPRLVSRETWAGNCKKKIISKYK